MLDELHPVIAGAGAVELVERAKPIAGDRDSIFKSALSKSHEDPQGATVVSKAQPDDNETVDLSKPDACAKLIQRAHSGGAVWQPFAESQDLAKAQEIATGGGRVVKIFKEHGETRFVVENV
jgi:hypothetical protein